MTKMIFTFRREQKEVAQLHLDVRPGSSVSGWTWHGDPAVKKAIKRLPNNTYSLEDSWHLAIIRESEKAGLTFDVRVEGDPLPLLD